jgi:hypothetical protein
MGMSICAGKAHFCEEEGCAARLGERLGGRNGGRLFVPQRHGGEEASRAATAPLKAAKAPKRSAATATRTERDEAEKVASHDRSSGNRQLSAKAGGILNGGQHLGMSAAAARRAPRVSMFAPLSQLMPATVPAPVGWER